MTDESTDQPSGTGSAQPSKRLARDLLGLVESPRSRDRTSPPAAVPTAALVPSPDAPTRPMKLPVVGRPLPAGVPTTIGPYTLISELGRGAMGAVYLAEERPLGRKVALKVVLPENAEDAELVQRFLREAQACAKLRHPHIVTVLGFGEDHGTHYYAMEYVEGRSLSDVLRREQVTQARAAALVRQAAEGLSHAHAAGVVHRDVKPANLMVTWAEVDRTDGLSHRELTAVAEADAAWKKRAGPPHSTTSPTVTAQHQDHVKVADFGLAKVIGAKTLTKTHGGMGTPLYMAPEQYKSARRVGPPADVYSLGATLYELLTGRPPFRGDDVPQIQARVENDDPVPPRKLEPSVDRDLEAITLKCLEKDHRRRYADAGSLAHDLARWLRGEPVVARRVSWAGRLWRRTLRHRKVVLPVAAALLAAAALGTWMAVGAWKRGDEVRRLIALATPLEAQADETASKQIYEQARASYHSAWTLDQASAAGRNGVARVNGKLEALAQAEADAEKLMEAGRSALDDATAYLYEHDARYDELARRLDRARTSFEQAVAKAPRIARAHYLLGRVWKLLAWPDKAEACYREAIDLDDRFAPAYFHLGVLKLEQRVGAMPAGRFGETLTEARTRADALLKDARLYLERAAELPIPEEDELSGFRLQASLASASKDRVRTRQVCEAALAAVGGKRGSEWLYFILAINSDPDERNRRIEEALQVRPQYALALFCRGIWRGTAGGESDAIADYDRAIAADPRFVEAILMRGHTRFVFLRDHEGALADCDRVLAIDPQSAPAFLLRGMVRGTSGDLDGSFVDIERALTIRPRYLMALTVRADHRRVKGDYDGAIADCERALAIDPKDLNALYTRGQVRFAQGDMEAAIKDFDLAIEVDPQDAASYDQRGFARLQLNDWDGALADCSKAVALDPQLASAYEHRALIRVVLADIDGVIADCDKALALSPRSEVAYFTRGGARLARGEFASAIADFDQVLSIHPEHLEGYVFRATALVQEGEFDAAINDFGHVLQVAPSDWARRAEVEQLLGATRATADACAWLTTLATAVEVFERGEYAAARSLYEDAVAAAGEADPEKAPLLQAAHYDLACIYAVGSVGKDGPAAEAKPVGAEEADRRREVAFRHLREAVGLGYSDARHLVEDGDLAPLRGDPRWNEILKRLPR